jgi:hypothetical protein
VSAREDYPRLGWMERFDAVDGGECGRALDEIEALRADVATFLAMLSKAGVEWPRA